MWGLIYGGMTTPLVTLGPTGGGGGGSILGMNRHGGKVIGGKSTDRINTFVDFLPIAFLHCKDYIAVNILWFIDEHNLMGYDICIYEGCQWIFYISN